MNKTMKDPQNISKHIQNQRNKTQISFMNENEQWKEEDNSLMKNIRHQAKQSDHQSGNTKTQGMTHQVQNHEDDYFSDLTIDNICSLKNDDIQLSDSQRCRQSNHSNYNNQITPLNEEDDNCLFNIQSIHNQIENNINHVQPSENKVQNFLKFTLKNPFQQNGCNQFEQKRFILQNVDKNRENLPQVEESNKDTKKSNLKEDEMRKENKQIQEMQQLRCESNKDNTRQNREYQQQREKLYYNFYHSKRYVKINTQELSFQSQTTYTNISQDQNNNTNLQPSRRQSLYSSKPEGDILVNYMQKCFIPKLRLSCQSSNLSKRSISVSQSIGRIRSTTINGSTTTTSNHPSHSHELNSQTTSSNQIKLQPNENSSKQDEPQQAPQTKAIQINRLELSKAGENQTIGHAVPDQYLICNSYKNMFQNTPYSTYYVSKSTKNTTKENTSFTSKREGQRPFQTNISQKENSVETDRKSLHSSQFTFQDSIPQKSSTTHQTKQFSVNKLTFQKNPFFYQSVKNNPSLINYIETPNPSFKQQLQQQEQQQQLQQQQQEELQQKTEIETQKTFSNIIESEMSDRQKSYSVVQLTRFNQNNVNLLSKSRIENSKSIQQDNQNILKESDLNARSNQNRCFDQQFKKSNKNQANVQSIILPLMPSDQRSTDKKINILNINSLSRLSSSEKTNFFQKKQFKRTLNISNMNNENIQTEAIATPQTKDKLNPLTPLKQLKLIYQPFQVTLRNFHNEGNLKFYC